MGGVSAVKIDHWKQSSVLVTVLSACIGLFVTIAVQSRTSTDPHNRLAHLQQFERKLGPRFTERLSAGGATMFHMAKVLSNPTMLSGLDSPRAREAFAKATALAGASTVAPSRPLQGPVPVNDATLDYQFTRFGGFTQSETSNAWCGKTIVAGFNDSGAFVRSVLAAVGGSSISGVATSQNGGRDFTTLPFLNPGQDPGTFLGGDPVVVCSDARHFAYASLLSQVNFDAQGNLIQALSGITVSRSSNSGLAWSNPAPAVTKDANFHFLDKEWMAIDPRNPQNLYITYTDFGAFGSDPNCHDHIIPGSGAGGPDVRIEMVASKDGGGTWSEPILIDEVCNLALEQNLSGTQVAVGPQGQVYVVYSAIDGKSVEVRLRRSADGGASFASTVVVAEGTAASVLGFNNLQANFRTNAFSSLTVDHSAGPHRGALYLVWTDASLHQVHDFLGDLFGDPDYSFGDIVLSTSNDQGATWSTPRLVSPTPASFSGAGRDQFMGGVSVDTNGTVAVCYSDRRNDPNNFTIDHFCSLSRDQGTTFQDVRETLSSWTPTRATDAFLNFSYMGDYDGVSSDATGVNPGFFSTFQVQTNTNPDVFGMRH
jgi:hypothetical protein